ncbi:MAG: regulatory protein RecX [Thalassobaculales bacterium]
MQPLSPAGLEKAALSYLERYAASTVQLRRVLERRVMRAAAAGLDTGQAAGWIAAILAKLARAGYLDDARFAAARAGSLHRQGRPAARIRQDLAARGVAAEQIDDALALLAADGGEDIAAARAFARRRRLGPWRSGPGGPERLRRELAALGRAGFSYEVARQALAGDAG